MSYSIKEERQYSHTGDKVVDALMGAVEGLEGNIVSNDTASGMIVIKFKKTILGKVLGEQTQVNVKMESLPSGETILDIEAYPLDAIGQKLMFGARKGVTRTVLDWLYAHLEHRLS